MIWLLKYTPFPPVGVIGGGMLKDPAALYLGEFLGNTVGSLRICVSADTESTHSAVRVQPRTSKGGLGLRSGLASCSQWAARLLFADTHGDRPSEFSFSELSTDQSPAGLPAGAQDRANFFFSTGGACAGRVVCAEELACGFKT